MTLALRQRGSLTVWFTPEAIAAWRAEPRTTRGGQPRYSGLAITTALTLRAVFRLALRQTEGLIGSILRLLGLDLAAPDHSTLSRRGRDIGGVATTTGQRTGAPAGGQHRAEALRARRVAGREARQRTRRSWRKLHIGVDADTGQIIAAELTGNDVDDGSQVGPLLEQVGGPVASFTGDGAYDRDDVYAVVASVIPRRRSLCRHAPARCRARRPRPRRRSATGTSSSSPSTAAWAGRRPLVTIGALWSRPTYRRWKRVIGDGLRSQTDGRQATEVAIAVAC